jgi:hypothetical protein
MKLEKYLEPEINRRIVEFFLENPSSLDTARGIATWINEGVKKTEKALNELAEAKILIPHSTNAATAYGYTTDAGIISRVKIGLRKFKTGKKTQR